MKPQLYQPAVAAAASSATGSLITASWQTFSDDASTEASVCSQDKLEEEILIQHEPAMMLAGNLEEDVLPQRQQEPAASLAAERTEVLSVTEDQTLEELPVTQYSEVEHEDLSFFCDILAAHRLQQPIRDAQMRRHLMQEPQPWRDFVRNNQVDQLPYLVTNVGFDCKACYRVDVR